MDESVIRNTFVDLDKRIIELERLFPIMKDRLQMYDKMVQDFTAILDEFIGIKSSVASQDSKIYDLDRSHSTAISQTIADMMSLKNEIYDTKITLSSLVKKSYEIENTFSTIKENTINNRTSIDVLKGTIDIVKKLSTPFEDFKNHKKMIADQMMNLGLSIENVRKSNNDTDKKANETSTLVNTLLDSHTNLIGKVYNISDNQTKLSEDPVTKRYVDEKLMVSLNAFQLSIIDDIKYLKNNIPSINLDDLQKDFQMKFDQSSLDGSNAILMTRNSAKQIQILEKKIESILLQLKSLELK